MPDVCALLSLSGAAVLHHDAKHAAVDGGSRDLSPSCPTAEGRQFTQQESKSDTHAAGEERSKRGKVQEKKTRYIPPIWPCGMNF